jgi:hypothetical protein
MSLRQAGVCPCVNVCPCGKLYVPAAMPVLCGKCMSLRQVYVLQHVCPCSTYVPAARMSLCQCMSLRQAVCPCGNVCPCGKCMFCSTYVPAARMSLQQCMSLRQADALQRKCLLARPNFEKEGKGRVRLRV